MGAKKLYLEYCYYYDHYLPRRRLPVCIAICVCMLWYKLQENRLAKRHIKYGSMLQRDLERERRLNRLYNGTEANCISKLRMRKFVFHRLCCHLRSRGLLEDIINVSIEEHVAMFLKFVGHRWTNISVVFEFLRSGKMVSRYFNSVLDALCILSRGIITMRTTETHTKISSSPGRFHPHFEVTYVYS
jgi:hypothetical protein